MGRLKDRIKYVFDNFMTKNPLSQILGLAVLVVIIIIAGTISASLLFLGDDIPEEMQGNFLDKMWWNFMRVIDPGTITSDQGFLIRVLSLFSTVGGILVFSILIGFVSSKIVVKLDELKKGRTKVIENNHTVILGWSPKVFTIISELVRSSLNKGKNIVVIMAEKRAADMYDEIKSQAGKLKRTKVICRFGNPIDLMDMQMLNINQAKSIIILSDEMEESDIKVIKTVLAITNNPQRKKGKYHIVTEISNMQNKSIAEIVGKDEIEIIFTNDLISRLLVQTARQSGLSIVYNELLSFSGSEIYFVSDPDIYGKSFKDIYYGYIDEIVIGYKTGNNIVTQPDPDCILKENDELIVLKDTKGLSKFNNKNIEFDDSIIISRKTHSRSKPEKILIIGWNKELVFIIHEIDKYVKTGSKILIVADMNDDNVKHKVKTKCNDVKNASLNFIKENYTNFATIEKICPQNYDSIIILTDDLKGITGEDKDANTLITLLFLREILNKHKNKRNINIVSEMINAKNKELAEVARINDFIISSKTISMILAQISEQKRINDFYAEIFDARGIEIYLKPVKNYIKTGIETNFYTILKAAFEVGQIAFGYKLKRFEFNKEKNFGIVINPAKKETVTFDDDDLIIVFAAK
ncbi:MAG: hypothetical protein JW822_14480 [Spirochaetales bacterium]|nr:hypothetical protein [Spirochaetales bacterium]